MPVPDSPPFLPHNTTPSGYRMHASPEIGSSRLADRQGSVSEFGTGMIRWAVTGLYQDMHFGSADVQTYYSYLYIYMHVCRVVTIAVMVIG